LHAGKVIAEFVCMDVACKSTTRLARRDGGAYRRHVAERDSWRDHRAGSGRSGGDGAQGSNGAEGSSAHPDSRARLDKQPRKRPDGDGVLA